MAKRAPLKIVGMSELRSLFTQVGRVPAKSAAKAARRGARVVANDVKRVAPVDTGMLRQGISTFPERSSKAGMGFFQVSYRSDMNDLFVKVSKAGKRAYYPASQEYGYKLRNGGYLGGYHFMRRAANAKEAETHSVMISVIAADLDKILKKG